VRDWASKGSLFLLYDWFFILAGQPSDALKFNGKGKGRILNKGNVAKGKAKSLRVKAMSLMAKAILLRAKALSRRLNLKDCLLIL